MTTNKEIAKYLAEIDYLGNQIDGLFIAREILQEKIATIRFQRNKKKEALLRLDPDQEVEDK